MNKKLCVIGLAALLAAPVAIAGGPVGAVTGYASMTEVDAGGTDDGTGFGIRGWAAVSDPWFVHGEYQTVTLDDSDLDVTSLRLGGGLTGELSQAAMWLAKAEYLDFGSDLDQSGFGVHGGIWLAASPQFRVFGTVGYLTTDDTDGIELNLGANFAFSKELAAVVDYRTYMGSIDPTGDIDITDLRFGIQYMFY